MAEHGIIFSGEMVRAILAGRKTQTRCVIKPQPPFHGDYAFPSPTVEGTWNFRSREYTRAALSNFPLRCLCGKKPGDKLWVREAWLTHEAFNELPPRAIPDDETIWYPHATGIAEANGSSLRNQFAGRRRSPRHMPRWASRLTPEVTAIRVERVQEISEADAIAEGLLSRCGDVYPQVNEYSCGDGFWTTKPRTAFLRLWESINGKKYPRESNPWVSILQFKVLSDG